MSTQEALIQITNDSLIATWPFTAISTVLFFMRTVSRIRQQKNTWGWADIIISISWPLNIVRAAAFQKALDSTKNISLTKTDQTVPVAAYWTIFVNTWAFVSIVVPKLGVAILLCDIFQPERWLKVIMLGLCILLQGLAVGGIVLSYVQCHPIPGQWDPFRYPETKCWHRGIQIIYSCVVSGFSAAADLMLSIYPGVVIWGLQMPTWKRVSAMALMSLGLASFAFAVVKLNSNTALIGDLDIFTQLYYGIHISLWNGIENDFVLSAACLPSIPPFFRICKSAISSRIGTSNYLTSLLSFKSYSRSRDRDRHGNMGEELVTYDKTPEGWDSKNNSVC